MAVCEGLALVTFARNKKWQDGQGGASKGCNIYVAKDYGMYCIAGIGKLCNSCSDFCFVDVVYGSGHILFGCELYR